MVFLIFSCASGPGAKEQGLCWSAADEQDDSGMRARGSTATCRTNCGTSHIASMLGWLLEVARDQLLFYDPMLACQTSWKCRSVVTGKSRLYDCHVHLFKWMLHHSRLVVDEGRGHSHARVFRVGSTRVCVQYFFMAQFASPQPQFDNSSDTASSFPQASSKPCLPATLTPPQRAWCLPCSQAR